MKKIIGAILFVGFITLVALSINNSVNQPQKEQSAITQQETAPVQRTNYLPGPPVNGPDFRVAAEMSVNAVVHIRSSFKTKSSVYDDFFGQFWRFFEDTPYRGRERMFIGYGSGVIISSDGYIVTNNHVVQGASEIEVTLNDKRKFNAEIIGNDGSTDLALVKINADDLPYLKYGNSDEVKIGEWVLAVGNPFNLTSTVTAGIVSAKARDVNIIGSTAAIESYIQTDAAINKGNSGGALVNTKGELIGINAAIASNTGYYEGYSFAIPVNIVRKVVDDFMKYGEIQRAYIGVIIREVNADLADKNDLNEITGVYVTAITENGGAEEAGIKIGDIIISIDGTKINSVSELLEVVGQRRPGERVEIKTLRDGEKKKFTVELKNERGTIEVVKSEEKYYHNELDAALREISSKEKNYLNIDEGFKIIELDDEGILKRAGIREGFIITRINNLPIKSFADIDFALKNSEYSLITIKGVYPNGMWVTYSFDI